MKNSLLLFLFILLFGSINAQWTQVGNSLYGDNDLDEFGEAVSNNAAGDIIAIGARLNDTAGDQYGQVKVFQLQSNDWQQLGNDLLGQAFPAAGEKFGWDLDLNDSGTRLVVGSPVFINGSTIPGVTRVFEFDGADWVQLGNDIEGENDQDLSGWSVAINSDGSRIITGSVGNSDNGVGSGQARIYEYDGSDWVKLGNDIEGESAYLTGGSGVAIDGAGEIVAVGFAENNDPSSGPGKGIVRIYELVGATWDQLGDDFLGDFEGDDFGTQISINQSGNRIALGARLHSGTQSFSGQTRVFEFQNNAWGQVGSAVEGNENEALGTSVSLNDQGNVLVAGGRANNPVDLQRGIVRVFRFSNGAWQQFGDSIYGEANEDKAGRGVASNAEGNIVVIGAPFNDTNGVDSGQARVFQNDPILSISESFTNNYLVLSPNPNSGRFSLDFSEEIDVSSITIINVLGKIVFSETNIPRGSFAIDQNFTSGVYFVNVISISSETTIKMIVE